MEYINPDAVLLTEMLEMSKPELKFLLKKCQKKIFDTIVKDKKQQKIENNRYCEKWFKLN